MHEQHLILSFSLTIENNLHGTRQLNIIFIKMKKAITAIVFNAIYGKSGIYLIKTKQLRA
jgi:hypothetical protein